VRQAEAVVVRVKGATGAKSVRVPKRAVKRGGEVHIVLVNNREGKAEQRPIVVGDWLGNDWFITDGLSAGDLVVVDGGLALRPGEPVTVKTQASALGTAPKAEGGKPQAGKGENKGGSG